MVEGTNPGYHWYHGLHETPHLPATGMVYVGSSTVLENPTYGLSAIITVSAPAQLSTTPHYHLVKYMPTSIDRCNTFTRLHGMVKEHKPMDTIGTVTLHTGTAYTGLCIVPENLTHGLIVVNHNSV